MDVSLIRSLIHFTIVVLPVILAGNLETKIEGECATYDPSNTLKCHIHALSEKIGPRNIGSEEHYQNLKRAAKYIKSELERMNVANESDSYTAKVKKSHMADMLRKTAPGLDNLQGYEVENIIVSIEGTDRTMPALVVGAHYDTYDESPGADDNASGVAALLEIARFTNLNPHQIKRTLKLVFFVNEERPYMEDLDSNAAGENMGSLRFARNASKNREKLYGMISLESIGYFTEDSKSQEFLKALGFRQKFPFKEKQTSRGDFVAFVGNFQSRSFLKNCEAAFKRTATVTKSGVQATAKLGAAIAGIDTKVSHPEEFPLLTVTMAEMIAPDIGRSDHKSFWSEGYHAIMITDTANFRNKHYHQVSDRIETINFVKLNKLVEKLKQMVKSLVVR
ncbi:peptidase family m28 domain-containing protein [Ditylenchus destructor]|uniref:Peptidase family m28 domain-containing protein n=1 Tax=Ditylenchus destructor TaxID=166010 RepID=A0AAD4R3S6_9BILA|nr:peptidase family m28 domain-containing protein [Ditylenchus destructor]